MNAGVLLGLALLFLVLFFYPYLIYPLILADLPERPIRKAPIDRSVSILFCAFNEAESLPAKIENLRRLKLARPTIEILAFDDGSTDGTASLLAGAGDVLQLVRGAGRAGKASGMKQLAAMAKGDILVFTDANVLLADNLFDRLLPYYGDDEVGGVCGTLVYGNEVDSATAEVGSAYWKLDEKLRSLESRTGNVMGADGSLFSIRRELYPSFPDSVLDDLTVSLNVVFLGRRLVKAGDVFAFENSVANRKDELRRKVRIGTRSLHTHRYLRPRLRRMEPIDRFKYASRKIVRWFGGITLGLSALFAIAALAAVSVKFAAVAIAAAALVATLAIVSQRGPLAKVADAGLAILATQLGVFKGMAGQSVATWTPAKSR